MATEEMAHELSLAMRWWGLSSSMHQLMRLPLTNGAAPRARLLLESQGLHARRHKVLSVLNGLSLPSRLPAAEGCLCTSMCAFNGSCRALQLGRALTCGS